MEDRVVLREDVELGPPRWETLPEGVRAWRVTRPADVRLILSDERFTREVRRAARVRAEHGLPPLPDRRIGRGVTLLDCDPPRHAALRASVNFAFVPRRVQRLRPWIEQEAEGLHAALRAQREAELSGEFATPLAAAGMCRLVGLPTEDLALFAPWVREVHGIDPTPEGGRRIVAAIEAMDDYIQHVIDERRLGSQQEDLLGAMITATAAGTGLREDDLVAMVRSILVGGYESTATLMVNGMLRLLTEAELFSRLRATPEQVPAFVEEVLRTDPPFPRVQERYPLEDVEVGGVLIPRGEPVVADLAAATGERNHLAFGPGVHHCLGAALARMEARVAFDVLLRHLPRPELTCAARELVWPPGILAGPSALPVRFGP
ncbi:cytochrome P450 [Allokutzneria sp. A3M-2-11 16]|uniref:cytochrome P450 n=1 Tax=Allokutzneria sp. A3M-2-11 16 TaxID=2962043 RepID=UPI0020B7DDFC|nr:cytochrome P450 [Allokutzneria sp. A3M-2-11 16]MCP3803484.1 cytochrome P450 [Allokutzneria sp. A3M-2-11 16]